MDPRATQPANLYPIATQEGQWIPLDAVKPQRLAIAAADDIITITAVDRLLIASPVAGSCVLQFRPGVSGALQQGAIFVRKDSDRIIVIPYFEEQQITVRAVSPEAGFAVYLQFIEVWEGMANTRRLSKGY